MKSKILDNIILKRESSGFIDCLYAVLNGRKEFDKPKYLLSGMTGFCFVFSAHKNLILASTKMYELNTTSRECLDIIGYYSECYDGLKTDLTFPLHQKKAIERIKESIDKGNPVIVWAAGIVDFQVIHGYDDEDEIFFYKDRYNEDDQVLLYKNFGKANASYWMCQIIDEKIQKDIRDIYMDSLIFALDRWELSYYNERTTNREIASGRKAHHYLIEALKNNEFDERGAYKILHYLINSRREAYHYLSHVSEEFPNIQDICKLYKELYSLDNENVKYIPTLRELLEGQRIDNKIPLSSIIHYCSLAYEIQEAAMKKLGEFLNETLNNRYVDFYDIRKFI